LLDAGGYAGFEAHALCMQVLTTAPTPLSPQVRGLRIPCADRGGLVRAGAEGESRCPEPHARDPPTLPRGSGQPGQRRRSRGR
jgi:hypothetical protein